MTFLWSLLAGLFNGIALWMLDKWHAHKSKPAG